MPHPVRLLPALVLVLACSAGDGSATRRDTARGEVGVIDPDAAAMATRMLAFADEAIAAGDSATAREYVAEAVRLDSTDTALRLRLARMDEALGNAGHALAGYRGVLARTPRGPVADETRRRIAALEAGGARASEPPPPRVPAERAAPAIAARPSAPASRTRPRTGPPRPPRAIRPVIDTAVSDGEVERSAPTPPPSARTRADAAADRRRRDARETTTGAIAGAAAGAVLGGVVDRSARGAVVGAGIGAVIGATAAEVRQARRAPASARPGSATTGARADTLARRDSVPPSDAGDPR